MCRAMLGLWNLIFALALTGGFPCWAADTSGDLIYSAHDYAFRGPDSIPAGWTTVQLINQGSDLHQLQFIKLPPGKSAAVFAAAISANHMRMPSWIERRGGPNSIVPGDHATAIVHLEPGNYVVICGIPDQRGIPHVALGMMKAVTVTAPPPAPSRGPLPDSTISLVDLSFELSGPIYVGQRTIQVVNKGTQAHEVVVVQLAPGATVRDFIMAFGSGVSDSPAGKPTGGMVGLDPGGEAFFRTDFLPGNYGLICFLPDLIRGSPHFALGMLMDVAVR